MHACDNRDMIQKEFLKILSASWRRVIKILMLEKGSLRAGWVLLTDCVKRISNKKIAKDSTI